jgi:hypothetical protein
LWTFYNEAYAPIYRDFHMTVIIGHDHGYPMIMVVFLFHHRPHVMVMGSFPSIPAWIVVVGVVILFHVVNLYRVFDLTVIFVARASPLYRSALRCLSRQVSFLNWMSWKIESSYYWAYAIYFWILVQSTFNYRGDGCGGNKVEYGSLLAWIR